MIFQNIPRPASSGSLCTPSRPFQFRQAFCITPPVPSNLRWAPRPWTRKILFSSFDFCFEWFILHNWSTYYKKIWDKVQTSLFEWIAVDRISTISLSVDGLISSAEVENSVRLEELFSTFQLFIQLFDLSTLLGPNQSCPLTATLWPPSSSLFLTSLSATPYPQLKSWKVE